MDEFTKKKVRRAMVDNPDLPAKFVITAIRAQQGKQFDQPKMRKRRAER